MQQGITLKLQMDVTPEQADALSDLQEQYRQACQYVSDYHFESRFTHSRFTLHDHLYREIRERFGLKAQQAQSVFLTVLARYKTVATLFQKKRYRYKDRHTGQWHSLKKDRHWLRKPIQFQKPQNEMVHNRDWNFTKEQTVKLTTLDGRIEVGCHFDYFASYLSDGWKLGTARLVHKQEKWFLHIGATKEIAEYDRAGTRHVVGIDRGLNFLLTSHDEQGRPPS